jgi:hypothetical protein
MGHEGKRIERRLWKPAAGWAAAIAIALVLAFATPHEQSVMGKLEPVAAKSMDQRPLVLPQGLPAERTLLLLLFHPDQRVEARSWVQGMALRESAYPWMVLRVLQEPGKEGDAIAAQQDLRSRPARDPARVVPLYTDPQAFARSLGLTGTAHAQVVVLDRSGNVLARAQGAFDEQKAQALRETLLQD